MQKMVTDKTLRNSLFDMFNAMFGEQRADFNFPTDANYAYLNAFVNNNPRPGDETLLYYYVDNVDNWKHARHAGVQSIYDRNTGITTTPFMRQFDCVVDIFSKGRGVAFDAMTFLVTALRGDRWEDLSITDGWFLGKESVSEPEIIRVIENSTWTTRARCSIRLNFRDALNLDDELVELAMPKNIDDMANITVFDGVGA